MTTPPPINPRLQGAICKAKCAGMTIPGLSKTYKLTERDIRDVLKWHGVNPYQKARKHTYNAMQKKAQKKREQRIQRLMEQFQAAIWKEVH